MMPDDVVTAYPVQEKESRLKTEGRRLPPLPGLSSLSAFACGSGAIRGEGVYFSVWRKARRERLSLATGSENDRKDENDEANDHSQ